MGFRNYLSKNTVLFLFVISAFLILTNVGCTRKVDGISNLKISIPTGLGSSKITNFTYPKAENFQSVSSQSEETGADWNVLLNPSPLVNASLNQINCYMVAITGPEPIMRRNACTLSTGGSMAIGKWIGGIPSGGSLTLEVPAGPQREITIIGFNTTAGSCIDFKSQEMDGSNLSEPHILGKTVQDLQAGNVNITVSTSLSANTLKIDDCQGPDFSGEGGGQGMFFGLGTAGNHTVTGVQDITTLGSPLMRSAYSKLTYVDPTADPSKTSVTVDSGADFYVNDEVMLMIMGGKGQLGPAANDYGSCGFRGWHGVYQFGRILSKSGNILDISRGTFLDKLHKDANGNSTEFETPDLALLNANLTNAPTDSTFCYIQIIRVPHFADLTINTASTLSAPTFDFAGTAGGGVLAFRVNNNLTMSSSTSYINMTAKGYQGVASLVGDGYLGRSSGCANNPDTGSGGGCVFSSSESGGGGGHGNNPPGNPFSSSGGNGFPNASIIGGNGAGEDCGDGSCFGNLQYKIFMGGAGGGSTPLASSGGHGGGIIFIAAKNIVATGGVIKSYGQTPSVSLKSGGGAAGSVILYYKTVDDPTGVAVSVIGGDGSDGGTHGGGGGGGGRLHLISCKLNGASRTLTNTSHAGGVPGAAGSTGAPGMNGFRATYDVDCQ